MRLILALLVFFSVILYDSLTMLKMANKKEIIVYSALMLISFATMVSYILGHPLPGPTKPIQKILDALLHLNF